MNEFSAFKLFYDEFIYKRNAVIDYKKIDKNINNIKKIVQDINSIYKGDKEFYTSKLDKATKALNKELDEMMKSDHLIFDLYLIIYKRCTNNLDRLEDMPLIISCSFYNDYKKVSNVVSIYTSLDKKNFRNKAKEMGYINFFIKVLQDRKKDYFKVLIDNIDLYNNIKINLNDSIKDIELENKELLETITSLLKRCENKAKLCEDYEIIKDIMSIAFKKDFNSFQDIIPKLTDNLLARYEELLNTNNNIYDNSRYNYLNYDEYSKILREDELNKIKFENDFNLKRKVNYIDSLYFNELKKTVVNTYFDLRLLNDNVEVISSYIDDLLIVLFNYKLFQATYSYRLNRNNSIKYAFIKNIYDLYNFDDIINTYLKKYRNDINKKLKSIIKEYIFKTYKNNLISECPDYDTREYDLTILLDNYSINEITNMYKDMNANLDISSSRDLTVCVTTTLAYKLGNNNINDDLLADIAYEYLKYDLSQTKKEKQDASKYDILYDKYLSLSSFERLKRTI